MKLTRQLIVTLFKYRHGVLDLDERYLAIYVGFVCVCVGRGQRLETGSSLCIVITFLLPLPTLIWTLVSCEPSPACQQQQHSALLFNSLNSLNSPAQSRGISPVGNLNRLSTTRSTR